MSVSQTLATVTLGVMIFGFATAAEGVTLSVGQVRQRYPWNGLVDIDYTIGYGAGEKLGPDDNLEVVLIDKSATPAVTNRAVCFLQVPLPTDAGTHRITWDANADGVKGNFEQAEIQVKVVHYPATYMVIDVSGGSATNAYPVDFVTGVSAESFNTDEYKKNKIVLRRIHQGSYVAGSPSDEAGRNPVNQGDETQHRVTISKPFYIGVFEVTAKQYKNVVGSYPTKTSTDNFPAGGVSWNDAKSFIGKLGPKCRAKDANGQYTVALSGFDLPTEFQWEYACRAGMTKAFNGSDDFDNTSQNAQKEQLALLGRYKPTSTSTKDILDPVGTYQPNAWGLYDMHGNVWEQCRDYYKAVVASPNQHDVDPEVTVATGTDYVKRGGSCNATVEVCRSALRSPAAVKQNLDFGFRLSFGGDASKCEEGLGVAEDLQCHEADLSIDLSESWIVESLGAIAISYSALGWGLTDLADGAVVRLACTEGELDDGVFSPSSNAYDLVTGLSGRGVYNWLPNVEKKTYRIQHLVTRNDRDVVEENLNAYFDFSDSRMATSAELLAAVQGVSQPLDCAYDIAHPWAFIGGDGEGARNSADGAKLGFSFKDTGRFTVELAFASGTVTVTLDGQAVETVTANAEWTPHSWFVADAGVHTLMLAYSGSDEIRVRGCALVDGAMRPLIALDAPEQVLDLREGVRTAHYFSEILPLTYSATKWTGDVAGSASVVKVVQLTGTGDDVTTWTESGPAVTLVDAPGEGAVKWKPTAGVWKTTLDVRNGETILDSGHEEAVFDLRKTRCKGFLLMIF